MKKLVVLGLGVLSSVLLFSCNSNVESGVASEKMTSRAVVSDALVHGGVYKIEAKCSGKAIDVAEWSNTPGTNIHQWEYVGGANQQWYLHETGDGAYTITSNFNGMCLDVAEWGTHAGANIQQWTNYVQSNQRWYFERQNDGYYKITSQYSGKVLDVDNARKDNGANIQQWDWNGTDAQRWLLTRVDVQIQPEPQKPAEDPNKITVDGRTYSLTFSDDFNGNSLDSSKWEKCPEWQRQDLGGYWDNDCSYVRDGNLVIECRNNNGRLESGAIRSRGKFQQNKGVYKVRFMAEQSSAVWYAFWLMTDAEANIGNGAVDGAEIDVFEIIGNDPWEAAGRKRYLNSAVHWDGYGANWQHNGSQHYVDAEFFGQWHEATFVWTDAGYKLYVDGNLIWDANGANYGGTCQTENYIKITAEFGEWGGPLNNALLPAHFYVDWVKVYN